MPPDDWITSGSPLVGLDRFRSPGRSATELLLPVAGFMLAKAVMTQLTFRVIRILYYRNRTSRWPISIVRVEWNDCYNSVPLCGSRRYALGKPYHVFVRFTIVIGYWFRRLSFVFDRFFVRTRQRDEGENRRGHCGVHICGVTGRYWAFSGLCKDKIRENLELITEPTKTRCGHSFCKACILKLLKKKKAHCPLCKESVNRRTISKDDHLQICIERFNALVAAVQNDSHLDDILSLSHQPRDTKESCCYPDARQH
ncbi:PREDICTED: uncharacterized protein LOC105569034 [Vollenhovia emeryi]|uniref:uncharacterized protein LOC105569034 n=1 Tax=Vollenhovia emeryi TaxID=411798 RepID=UPI0005F3D0D8|nr:PREDICTED: uncharacterized protein LOC105569034 [Vollenhovia emeryi]